MNTIADILKNTNFAQRIAEQNRVASSISEVLRRANFAQRVAMQNNAANSITKMIQSSGMQNQLNNLNSYDSVFKNITHADQLKAFKGATGIANLIAFQHKNLVPQTTLQTIGSIVNKQQDFLENLKGLDKFNKQLSFASQIPNFKLAINDISSQFSQLAASHRKWDLLEDFEEISANAISINEDVIEKEGITKENLNELRSLLESIDVKIDKQNKNINVIEVLLKFITLISFVLAIMAESRHYKPKPDYATKEEVNEIITKQFQSFKTILKENGEGKTVIRKCKVMLRPRKRSMVLSYLPKDYDLIVLNTFHKWAYISYLNPKDGLPQTGWVMKKYLVKKK